MDKGMKSKPDPRTLPRFPQHPSGGTQDTASPFGEHNEKAQQLADGNLPQ